MENSEVLAQSGPALQMSSGRRWAVTAGVLLGMFLAALEVTIVGTAMPTVIASLGGLTHYSWVFSAYIITSTVPVPVWGKLSDIYGRRLLFQLGIGVFLVGSVLSGMASSMTQLIVYRAVQGLGAGVLVPLTMTIIGDIYTLRERTRMQAVFSGVWGLSSIVGPLIGGLITDHFSWRWVFYINVPFGLAAALVLGLSLREPPRQTRPNIDFAGAASLIVAVTLLMLALVEAGNHPGALLEPANLALIAASALVFIAFVAIERRALDPIMPPSLFRNPVVRVALACGFCAGVGMFGAISFVPFFAQGVLEMSATAAGSLLTPLLVSWVIAGAVGGRLLLRVGFRRMAQCGALCMTVGLAALGTSGRTTGGLQLSTELAVLGAGLGLVVLTMLLASQSAVARDQLGLATSLTQFSRSIGGALGVAVMGAVLSGTLGSRLLAQATASGPLTPDLAHQLAANPNALIEPAARAELAPGALDALQDALAGALANSFWLAAGFAALAFVLLFWLPQQPGKPAEESCSVETGERLLLAEMTTLDAGHEPLGV